jgi:PST family polysaccharide transporter
LRLIINFISKIGVDSFSRLIGFLTLPFITRTLGPEGYGAYSFLFVIVSYYGFFIDFGYLNYGTNKLCEKERSEDVIGRILSLQILTAIASYIVIIISGLVFLERDKFLSILLFSLIFIPQIIAIKYFYLAANKLYYNSIAELSGQVIYAALVFTFFAMKPEINTLIIIAVIQAFVIGLVLFIPFIKKNKVILNLSLADNLQTLKEAYKLGLSSKAEGITSSFIILITGMFLTEHAVGLYNASYKIYLILLTVIQGLSYAMMPMLLKNVKQSGRSNTGKLSIIFYSFVVAGLFLGTLTFVFSDRIINLMFGSDYTDSIAVLKWFSITLLLWPFVMFTALLLLALNQFGKLLTLSIISMISSIVLSIVLINALGLTGSAMVLPAVAVISSITGLILLMKSEGEDKLNLSYVVSPSSLFQGISDTLSKVKS